MKDPSCYHEIMDSAALVKAKMDDLNSKISSLLTDDQKAKFEKMKSEKRKRTK